MGTMKLRGREVFYLEKINMGEFVPGDRLADFPDGLRQRSLENLRREDGEFFAKYPVEEQSRELTKLLEEAQEGKEKYEKKKKIVGFIPGHSTSGRQAPLLAVAMLVAMMAVTAGFFGFFPGLTGEDPASQVRIKGMEPVLNIYRAEGSTARMLEEREVAEQYDLLQIEYNGAGFPYGTVFSIDGRGTVTLHYPASTDQVPELETGAVLLPYSYQLDDAPDFERFFFVVSPEKFEVTRVLGAAEKLSAAPDHGRVGELALAENFAQSSVVILKEEK